VVSVTPRPHFSPGERTPCTYRTGGWVGPRAGLGTEARGKILSPLPGIDRRSLGRSVLSQTLYWLSYPANTGINIAYFLQVRLELRHFETENARWSMIWFKLSRK
jgi:hypothetical protein